MKEKLIRNLHRTLLALVMLGVASSVALASATITIQNNDPAGTGFNDPTPVSPVGGNGGTTLGQQRLIAFQTAANIWGATLNSGPTIVVRANWSSTMACTATTATLGAAGALGTHSNFANAPFANVLYPRALANALAGTDLSLNPEIAATFNSRLGTPGCLENSGGWYLGLDGNHGNSIDLVVVLLHEFAHGLGVQTFTNESTGAQSQGLPTIYDRFLLDKTISKTWDQMTNAERVASAVNSGNLVWAGPNVTAAVPSVLLPIASLRVNLPPAIAANYTVGTAEFGAQVSSPGVTADVIRALDAADGSGPSTTDGCSPFTNAGAVAGKIAFIDRGDCNFTVKVKNAQNAGATTVVIGNVASSLPDPTIPPTMGGTDPTIVIPSVSINLADADLLRGQFGVGINASVFRDNTSLSGADDAGRVLMYAPNPVDEGSSISHFDRSAFPNQLMEPNISGDLTHNVGPPFDLTFPLLRDLGWTGQTSSNNPLDDPRFFVRQQYIDFLNREPDSSGWDFWTNEITSCGGDAQCIEVKRINVSAAFFLSIEFQETGFLVYRMYKAAYGDTTSPNVPIPVPIIRFNEFLPDAQRVAQGVQVGIGNWQAQLEANKTAYAREVVVRQRFLTDYPLTMPAAQFVDQLNLRAGNVLSAAERDQLIAELNATGDVTVGRASVLRKVAEDADLRQRETNRAFVLMQYYGYLRRNPDDSPDTDFRGWEFWLNKLNQFNGNFIQAEMVKAFIISIEYRQRFGQ